MSGKKAKDALFFVSRFATFYPAQQRCAVIVEDIVYSRKTYCLFPVQKDRYKKGVLPKQESNTPTQKLVFYVINSLLYLW
ncbi:hypothetical protein FX988_00993 [Paraglaciecola mesophila]|uniref:Uncharacterized protein n=1 Tax=Paraglaciecola mesophila TaxID=197222 RepID=A0A857JHJ8_9ALTE|nr:hypothetical protein FX988_00993 [Paraglaciecola mesophila]